MGEFWGMVVVVTMMMMVAHSKPNNVNNTDEELRDCDRGDSAGDA